MAPPGSRWYRSTVSRRISPISRPAARSRPGTARSRRFATPTARRSLQWANSISRPASMPERAVALDPGAAAQPDEILRVEDLSVNFTLTRGLLLRRAAGTVKAVDQVSFALRRGETLGLVGESGCGKSTTGLAILRMLEPTAGRIVFEGADITGYGKDRMRPIRQRMQMVYQDPYSSLNPRMRVRNIIGEPLEVHGEAGDRAAYRERIDQLMRLVGLLPNMADRYPHEFSGGQRQRIGIARALALN